MNVTLYLPHQPSRQLSINESEFPDMAGVPVAVPAWVPETLGCVPGLVDVLASGPGFVAYSVFDYDSGPVNEAAMRELAGLTGVAFEPGDEDTVLLGPILIVHG